MAKYKLTWNIGYGDMEEVVEAESFDEAENLAYENWREAIENDANYWAEKIED